MLDTIDLTFDRISSKKAKEATGTVRTLVFLAHFSFSPSHQLAIALPLAGFPLFGTSLFLWKSWPACSGIPQPLGERTRVLARTIVLASCCGRRDVVLALGSGLQLVRHAIAAQ